MDIRIGKDAHYYNHISAAVVNLSSELRVEDTIYFLGHTTDFEQPVGSMEINHHKIPSAGPGSEVVLKVAEEYFRIDTVRKGVVVFKSEEG